MRRASGQGDSSGRPTRSRLTIELPGDLVEEVKDAVVWLQKNDEDETLAKFVAEALRGRLAHLRQQHDFGPRFPRRANPKLRPGARIKP